MAVVLRESCLGDAMGRTREILGMGNDTWFGGMSRRIKNTGQGCKAVGSGDGTWSCCCLSLGKAVCRWWGKQGLGVLVGFLQSVHL